MRGPKRLAPFEDNKWEEGKLGEALAWVMNNECDGARAVTMKEDYSIRSRWLIRVFGDCHLADVCGRSGYLAMRRAFLTYKFLEAEDDEDAEDEGLSPDDIRPAGSIRRIANVTIKKRFKFMLRALRCAASRELIRRDQIPALPKIPNDEKPETDFWTQSEYEAVRTKVEFPWQRFVLDLGFWTGSHRRDIWETKWWHIDVERPIKTEAGKIEGFGMFWFRNSKTEKHVPNWQPMHPHLRARIFEFMKTVDSRKPDELVVGKFYKPRTWIDPACEAAGIKRLHLKNLRQSRAKWLEEQGVGFGDLRYLMGHIGISSRITTTFYLGTVMTPGTMIRIHRQLSGARKPPKHVGGSRQVDAKKNRGGP